MLRRNVATRFQEALMFRRPLATALIALALASGVTACSGDDDVDAKRVTDNGNDASSGDQGGSSDEDNGGSSVGTGGRGRAGNNASRGRSEDDEHAMHVDSGLLDAWHRSGKRAGKLWR